MGALNKLKTLRTTATTTAQPLSATRLYVKSFTIKNPGAGAVNVGDSSVTSTSGFSIANGETVDIVPDPNEMEVDLNEVYVVASSGTSDLHVFYVVRD